MKFRCYGVNRASGEQMTPMEVEAADEDSAIAEAKSHGMLVEKCESVPSVTHVTQARQETAALRSDYPVLEQLSGLYQVAAIIWVVLAGLVLCVAALLIASGGIVPGILLALAAVGLGSVGYIILIGASAFIRLMMNMAADVKQLRVASVGGLELKETV